MKEWQEESRSKRKPKNNNKNKSCLDLKMIYVRDPGEM